MPLREEGVDPALIGTKVADGKSDDFLWIAPGDEAYIPFGKEDWEKIADGSARL